MLPVIYRVLARYAPFVTLPVAIIVGIVGYNLENYLSDKYTPYQESISQKRTERLLESNQESSDSLKVLEKNLSPSLKEEMKRRSHNIFK